ncbi:MAG: hypothetical protein H7249_16300 [Chitinophagaceae bacterium]|nr:hypothetical protein [Oligoflexus sp.]
MPSKSSKKHQEEAKLETAKAELKAPKKGKQISGGEASKHAKSMSDQELQQKEIDVAEGHDHKHGNIGPSGQGRHRGRESANRQSSASGRPDHSAASPGAPVSGQ